jgi:hypothetical protein
LSQTAGPGEADVEDGIAAAVSGNEAGSEGSAIEIFEPEEYGADEPEYDESGSDESEYEETDYDESGSDESDYDEPGYEESDYDEPGYEESDYEESDYDDSDYDESGSDEDDYDESESDDSDYDVFGSGDAEYDESDTNDRDEPDIDGTVYDEAECGGDDSDGSQADYRNGEESGSEASDGDRPDEAQIDGSVSGESSKDALTDGPAETEEQEFHADPEELTAIVNCIGMDNLAELHNQLIQFYGENGKDVYKSLKSLAPSIEKKGWSREEKFLYYCVLILRHSDEPEEALREENVRELAEFLLGAENKRKNLNSLRYAMLKHYGKEKGRRYYFMLKPYVKALNQM